MTTSINAQDSHPQNHQPLVDDALSYADHVLSQPRRQADHAGAQHLKDLAQALNQRRTLSRGKTQRRFSDTDAFTVSYHLALLRGSAPIPRPLSFVKADPMALKPEHRGLVGGNGAFRTALSLLFLGEHPNMPGHGAVHDVANGRLYVGVHLNELVEIVQD